MKIIIAIVLTALIALISGLLIGFVVSKKMFDKELKKNPPISEYQIRILFSQLGINNERRIQQVLKKMNIERNYKKWLKYSKK